MSSAVSRYLLAWSLLTLLGCIALHAQCRMALVPLPNVELARWSSDALAGALRDLPLTAAPQGADAYRAAGPVFVSAYVDGVRVARHVGDAALVSTVRAAGRAFFRDAALRAAKRVRFRVELTRGSAPLLAALPWLSAFSLVPLRDGLCATLKEKRACVTPDDIQAAGLYDHAVDAPIPDLTFGTDTNVLEAQLAQELAVTPAELRAQARVRRVRIDALDPWPADSPAPAPTRAQLEDAARDGARFLLRHQAKNGRYTYVYDAQQDLAAPQAGYNITRHGGATFFLAQAARQLQLPEARDGALRALTFVKRSALTTCGAPDRACVLQGDRPEIGGSALAALAAAELLAGGDDEGTRKLLGRLTAFLRAQQRPDGELMHEYDRGSDRPIDVQHMYYSGEAAVALLAAYEQTRDARDLEAARRLMTHLTGAGWSFFGSRYFYGEEHWTCQAVGKAAAYMDVSAAVDFCLRWARWQGKLQYQRGQTPWPVEGALGVGPVLVPRITMPASRVEASVPIFHVLHAHDPNDASARELRALIEPSLSLLLRMRWAPGPAHLFKNPASARGGMPGTPVELTSRADMVQHAGSAMLAWAERGVFAP